MADASDLRSICDCGIIGAMKPGAADDRLSQISTMWTMLLRAHGEPDDAARAARREMLERYGRAAHRYLLGAVRDPDAATELAQELAVRFLRGDFHRADPDRGRFRDYLKTALIHLVIDYRRAEGARPRALAHDPPAPMPPESDDEIFLAGWRGELLDRTWDALATAHPSSHAALLLRVEQPEWTSAQLADEIARRTGKPGTPAAARKAIERGHGQFAALLIEEVARSLDRPSRADIEEELKALDLLRYCRSALESWRSADRNSS